MGAGKRVKRPSRPGKRVKRPSRPGIRRPGRPDIRRPSRPSRGWLIIRRPSRPIIRRLEGLVGRVGVSSLIEGLVLED